MEEPLCSLHHRPKMNLSLADFLNNVPSCSYVDVEKTSWDWGKWTCLIKNVMYFMPQPVNDKATPSMVGSITSSNISAFPLSISSPHED